MRFAGVRGRSGHGHSEPGPDVAVRESSRTSRARSADDSPITGLVALVSVPLATSSGEWLEHRERETALLERHVRLADGLLPWSIAVFALLVLWWGWHRFAAPRVTSAGAVRAVAVVGPVLLVAAAVGSLVEVVAIGHAGAVSVWKG